MAEMLAMQGGVLPAKGSVTTTVTYNQTNTWTDSDGQEHAITTSTTVTWMRKLGNLGNRANDRVEDVARDRGANGSNIKELGHCKKY